jgi:predicted metal-dependent hydrolase
LGRDEPRPRPIPEEREGTGSPTFDEGRFLFNQGYYWEAHEAWESLWHAHGRVGPTADLLKALIKLAAAGVKVREGQPNGVATHAGRAQALVESVRDRVGDTWLGLELSALAARSRELAEHPPATRYPREAAVIRVFAFDL